MARGWRGKHRGKAWQGLAQCGKAWRAQHGRSRGVARRGKVWQGVARRSRGVARRGKAFPSGNKSKIISEDNGALSHDSTYHVTFEQRYHQTQLQDTLAICSRNAKCHDVADHMHGSLQGLEQHHPQKQAYDPHGCRQAEQWHHVSSPHSCSLFRECERSRHLWQGPGSTT